MSCLIELSNLKATVNICRQPSVTCMPLNQSYGSQDMQINMKSVTFFGQNLSKNLSMWRKVIVLTSVTFHS